MPHNTSAPSPRIDPEQTTCDDRVTDRDEFLRDENTCCLCGDQLRFAYQSEPELLIVKEEACCPSCQIRLRSRSYRIHSLREHPLIDIGVRVSS